MKKIYTVKFSRENDETTINITTTIQADNRREAKIMVEEMAKTMNATDWYFELV